MIDPNVPEINVDEIMEKIRQEVQKRKGIDKDSIVSAPHPSQSKSNTSEIEHLAIDFPRENTLFEIKKDGYNANDFLKFYGQEFVVNAYKGILRRQPDPEGLNNFLKNLRQGHITKIEVLGRLRYSPEGRTRPTKVKGLLLPFVVHSSFRIPILGYLSRLITGIFQLPTIIKNLQNLDSHTHIYFQELERRFSGVSNSIQGKLNELIDRQSTVIGELVSFMETQTLFENKINQKADLAAVEALATQKADLSAVEALATQKADLSVVEALAADQSLQAEMKSLENKFSENFQQINNLRRSLAETERRLGVFLEEAIKCLPAPFDQEQLEKITDEAQHMFDALYVAFEDKFRGSREDIKGRVEIYLPYVIEACKVTDNAPILDVGCGRGEWLELLNENGLAAQGVDINRVMISESLDRGFDVVEEDAVSFLKRQPADSLSAITGFHIVEHLPFEMMITLFDESLRVLKSGGLVIFETPNPRNLFVGAGDFYRDPTHKRPIFPDSLSFIAAERGFIENSTYFMKYENSKLILIDSQNVHFNDLNDYLDVSRDFALIGHKI